jgi:hypothetical protein
MNIFRYFRQINKIVLVAFLCTIINNSTVGQPGTAEEPVRFIGKLDVDFSRPDGKLPPVIGAHSYQVLRSVRNNKELGDGLGYTFHHHPMLTYWKNNFYVLCNACPVHEERGLTEILLMKSNNGANWSKPEIIFPHVMYKNEPTFCNHRMGFYIAPSGKLYASTAYFPQSEMPPQKGSEDTSKKYFGVVLREIKEDGTYGKIYFVAQNNSLYKQDEFPFPYYLSSSDKGFIADCESLRDDKLITLHWWEQIRPEDFNFPKTLVNQIKNGNRKFAKAISYYHRNDSAIVALWKDSKSALSYDKGSSWTNVIDLKTFSDGYAKVWGQRTEDGKFAASWRPIGEGSWGRYPMLWATSNDGITYAGAMHVNDEVTLRYEGGSKEIGPCNYQIGIYEGGAQIPGDDIWVVYSMSKEDIWISRIPVPLLSEEKLNVNQTFDEKNSIIALQGWNIFSPQWAPIKILPIDKKGNKCLVFNDKDPYDYAKAFKVFKESSDLLNISFSVLAKQNNHGRFEIEIGNTEQLAPIKLMLTPQGKLQISDWHGIVNIGEYTLNNWIKFELKIDVIANTFNISINGKEINRNFTFNSKKIKMLDRITFRTGINRGISINPIDPETDLPLKKEASYYLDNVIVK